MSDVDEIDVDRPEQTSGGLESGSNLSALKDNIVRKGKNAYYYAHGHGANGPGNMESSLASHLESFPGFSI